MPSNDEIESGQEPYWRVLDNKVNMKLRDRLLDLATRFDLDTVKKLDADDGVAIRIGPEDFEFIQKKMQDEFYVSPKDVVHDALCYLQKSGDEHRKKLEERNEKNPSDLSIAEFFEKAELDGTLGTPEFNEEFNRRFCDSDDLHKKLSDGAELEY